MDTKTEKVTIDAPITVNDKVYFAGELELPAKDAEAVQAALKERQAVQAEYGEGVAPMTKEAAGPSASGGTQTNGGQKKPGQGKDGGEE